MTSSPPKARHARAILENRRHVPERALFGSMTLLENVRLPLEEYTSLDDDAIDLVR
jgi:ABC-type transporter Mla maintaining outer membrane lipid asymmetry ATPase subunit MlaF